MDYQVHHLSHTDLDGYGAQIISNHYLDNILFYNSNYGKEISENFGEIFDNIKKSEKKYHLLIMTDINLTENQCDFLERQKILIDKEIHFVLLDHHLSGKECSEIYPWYHLDDTKCATQITYDFFKDLYGGDETLAKFSKIVNAIDIWDETDDDFELGKVFMAGISGAKEINRVMFKKENTDYMFGLLNAMMQYINEENPHIKLDEKMHAIKKKFFKENEDNTLNNLISKYNVKLLNKNKKNMTFEYRKNKGILTYNIGNVSIIGNEFLKSNPEYDFFMDITNKRTISLRSNDKVDVSKIAYQIGNGGGHPNASGGILLGFRDGFVYSNIKYQVEDLIKKVQTNANK